MKRWPHTMDPCISAIMCTWFTKQDDHLSHHAFHAAAAAIDSGNPENLHED